jgi:hypothetical protein
MIGRLAFAILAGVALPLPGMAAPLTPEPAPAALEIARALFDMLSPRREPERAVEEMSIEEGLLNGLDSEPACDASNAECRAAARSVARLYAPEVHRLDRERRIRFFAYLLQDRMSPDQLVRVAAHLGTDEGRLFLEAWSTVFSGDGPSPRWREIEAHLAATMPSAMRDAHALFRRRTAHLPRTREPPPAMMPQTPSPMPSPMPSPSSPRGEAP